MRVTRTSEIFTVISPQRLSLGYGTITQIDFLPQRDGEFFPSSAVNMTVINPHGTVNTTKLPRSHSKLPNRSSRSSFLLYLPASQERESALRSSKGGANQSLTAVELLWYAPIKISEPGSTGEMECWSVGVLGFRSITPLLHHSGTPIFVAL